MQYMGSKRRIVKQILPILLAERKPDQWWVEPFVGGGNVIEQVTGKRLGADIFPWLIDALTSIRDCASDLPKNNSEFTEADYKRMRHDDSYRYKGYAGFAFSFGGKWMGGYAKNNAGSDYVARAYSSASVQSKLLQGVKIRLSGYDELDIPPSSLIYCDPPYMGTTQYKNKFDHGAFWDWCRLKVREGHTLFVSEYTAPPDFVCVWSSPLRNKLAKKTETDRPIEKLFRLYPVNR